ncbi:TetR/AcrR family transcriptional regulator [Conexibacter sp. SYSU D00693]|uniref:TetR/AcrR family transcriptional regulator n=1 Tax=Conexibacter sp. SYSU D00693 TaxID=2812560 RepID=UPI00196B1BB9|nr:TetR/AcrR family transcriptional regulator [Conexibacter sp. SYSU D00693]
MSPGGRPATTPPDAWAQAALDEVEAAGVKALSVEAVARRLGVSKGGAYHHFRDRRDLLRAALALWERRQVTELNAQFAAVADPRERLHVALVEAFVALEPTVIVQFMAASDDPDVAAALERSTAARLALLRRTFRQLGATRAQAEHRAILAYGHYLGFAQLRRHAPDLLATPARLRAHLAQLERSLLEGL